MYFLFAKYYGRLTMKCMLSNANRAFPFISRFILFFYGE